ncbi:MAG: PEGA domain-containing protein [Phycisphaerales bacterium]|nr:PEGA domain-containing protein [Phycisphaerales bacterium]
MNAAKSRTIAAGVGVMAVVVLALGGCLKRTIHVTSEPPGALVWINDVEVGRTPLQTDFTHYGTYDVRVRREGYEPIIVKQKANAPVYELPPLDIAAEAVPAKLHNVVKWHYVLLPVVEANPDKEAGEREVIERARELRGKLAPEDTAK